MSLSLYPTFLIFSTKIFFSSKSRQYLSFFKSIYFVCPSCPIFLLSDLGTESSSLKIKSYSFRLFTSGYNIWDTSPKRVLESFSPGNELDYLSFSSRGCKVFIDLSTRPEWVDSHNGSFLLLHPTFLSL